MNLDPRTPLTDEEVYLAYKAGIIDEIPPRVKPMTRYQAYLAMWCGQTLDRTPTQPYTREEAYVATLAGIPNVLPDKARTRLQAYYEHIIKGDTPIPDYPITREEYYLSILTKITSGPVSFEPNIRLETDDGKIFGLTIYGNTKQAKYTGKNIIDTLAFTTLYGNRTNTDTGTIVKRGNSDKPSIGVYSIGHNADRKMWNHIVARTDVVLSFSVRSLTNQKLDFVYRLEPLAYNNIQLTTSWQKVVYKVPKSNANNFTAFVFYASKLDMTDPDCGFEIKDVQIEAGTEATDYEPYIGSVLPNGFANLFDEFSNLPLSRDGVTLSDQNGVLKLTGQPTADWISLTSRNITSFLQDKQTYTVFQPNTYGVKLYPEVIAQRKNGGPSKSWNGQNTKIFTFTVDFDTYSSYSMKLQMGPKTSYPEPITFYNNYALFVGNYTADNLPEYSPYNTPLASPRPQYSQVVKELSGGSIAVKNKNLLKISNIPIISNGLSSTVADDGTVTYSGQIVNSWGDISKYTIFNSPLPAGTYTFSIDHPRTHRIIFKYRLADYNFYEQIANMTATSTSDTFTVNQPIISGYLYVAAVNGSNLNDTVKAQLESGNTATAYEPYQEQTLTIPSSFRLYKLTDDIYDELRLENGVAKLIKRVGKLELSGDESFDSISAEVDGQFYIFSSVIDESIKRGSFAPVVCSHMNMKNGIWRGLITSISVVSTKLLENDTQALRFMFSAPDAQSLKITNVASFKNWLKDEKAKGTPVTVYYEMKTPTEEEITDPAILTELKKLMEMRTYKDITNISITSTNGVTPGLSIKYLPKGATDIK